MSVLACSRQGCENIMCDKYSYIYGYICDECFEGLVVYVDEKYTGPDGHPLDFLIKCYMIGSKPMIKYTYRTALEDIFK